MKLEINDPRLLQYVLNEISVNDKIIVEDALRSQPEIAEEVDQLKRTFAQIESYENEPRDLSLSAERKRDLFQKTIYKSSASAPSSWSKFSKWLYPVGGLVAATFAFMVFNHSLKNEVHRPMNEADFVASPIPTQPAVNLSQAEKLAPAKRVTEEKPVEKNEVAKSDKMAVAAGVAASVPAPAQPPAEAMAADALTDEDQKQETLALMKEKKAELMQAKSMEKSMASGQAAFVARKKYVVPQVEVNVVADKEQDLAVSLTTQIQQTFLACIVKNQIQKNQTFTYEPQFKKLTSDWSEPSEQQKALLECGQKTLSQLIDSKLKVFQIEIKFGPN